MKYTYILTRAICTSILIFASITFSYAQIMPGGPGQQPEEVKAAKITSGAVLGNVNTQRGTYSMTHTLGSVSTLSGPSFTLTASYSSEVTAGTIPTEINGYPLGEGWSLNLPMITCDVKQFKKYNEIQQKQITGPSSGNEENMFYRYHEIARENSLHFLNINISIPGVYSGKAVYKYTDGGIHYFAPHMFTNPLIIKLWGDTWEVIAENGDVYSFTPTPMVKKNSNLRHHLYPDYATNSPTYNFYHSSASDRTRPYVVPHHDTGEDSIAYPPLPASQTDLLYPSFNNLKPMEAIAEWRCVNIKNPKSQERIGFYGSYSGTEKNYFWHWLQEFMTGQPYYSPYDYTPRINNYEDYYLKEIRSSTEKLELSYDYLSSENPGDCDDVYCKELVFEGDGETWRRYKHAATVGSERGKENFASSSNPYIYKGLTQGYYYDNVNAVNNEIGSFSHGFFESPALAISEYDQGDYLLEFEVTNNSEHPLLLDVNIAQDFRAEQGTSNSNGGSVMPEQQSSSLRINSLNNTFNNGLKYISKAGHDGKFRFQFNIDPLSVLEYTNTYLQIGPANSDHLFNTDLSSDLLGNYYTIPGILLYMSQSSRGMAL